MKKKIEVNIRKLIEVEIPDELLTAECLEEFSQVISDVDSIEDLFQTVAETIALNGFCYAPIYGNVAFKELWADVDLEIIE